MRSLTARLNARARLLAAAPPAVLAAAMLLGATPARAAIPYTAYVGNYGSGTVTAIDTGTNTAGPPITVSSPQAIAITPNGATAYVCNWSAGTVTPVALASGAVASPITVGTNPSSIAITPDGSKALVSNYNANNEGTVTVITLRSGATETINVGKGPYGVAITPDGAKAYVANHYDGTVTPITVATDTAGTPITVGSGADVARTDWVAASPDGSTVYAANYGTGEIVPINVASNTAGAPITGIASPNAIAITPDGAGAYVAEDGTPGHVVALNLSTRTLGNTVAVNNNPYDIAITPDQTRAYVADYNNDGSGLVTPLNLSTGTAGSAIAVGTGPAAIAIGPDQAPAASFEAALAPAGSVSRFDASRSTVPYGSITSYAWSFGDGSALSSSSPVVTHAYSAPGEYTVTLTETDAAGTSTTQVFTGKTVSRNGGPSATASATVAIGPVPAGGDTTPAAPGPDSPSAPTAPSATHPVAVVISARALTATPSGEVAIVVRCPASATAGCSGTITLALAEGSAKGARARAARCARGCRKLGGASYEARAGQTVHVRARMASFARRMLARRGALRVTVTATSYVGSSAASSVQTVTLRSRSRGRRPPPRSG